jgi:hypothetical protein
MVRVFLVMVIGWFRDLGLRAKPALWRAYRVRRQAWGGRRYLLLLSPHLPMHITRPSAVAT